jgi:hypothetical protein
VTADVTLQRLAALRRRHEQRALEALVFQAGLLRRAEQQAEAAARSARRHMDAARARERELIGSLAERAVSQAAIIRIQTELDRAALETARLRAAVARAQASLLKEQSARAEAGVNFRLRQRAAAKLNLVCEHETACRSRWDAALNEAENEGPSTSDPPPQAPWERGRLARTIGTTERNAGGTPALPGRRVE